MAQQTDDRDIRQALADLSAGQPPVPPGRSASVRRRVVRHRRHQVTGVVVSAVVIAGVVAGVIRLPALDTAPQAPVRHVPAWALDWADHRNGTVPQQVLDRAVLAWMDTTGPDMSGTGPVTSPAPGSTASQVARQASTYPVVWYVGQTVNDGQDQDVVVMFEADSPAGPQLVVGQAKADNVMQDQPAWSRAMSPWALTTVAAPSPHRPPAAIGEYLSGSEPLVTGQNPDNWMVVLTAPDVTRLSWAVGTPAAGAGLARYSAATSRGLVVIDNGQISSAVQLTGETTAHGVIPIANEPVGVPGSAADAPELAAPPPLALPGSFSFSWGQQGPGSSAEGDYSFYRSTRQYALYGICYGPEPVKITVDGHRIGSIACDSKTHELLVRPPR